MSNAERIEGLMAMATQDVSPRERDIARDKLATMGMWPPPPRPPAPAGAAGFGDEQPWQPRPATGHAWTTSGSSTVNGNVRVEVSVDGTTWVQWTLTTPSDR